MSESEEKVSNMFESKDLEPNFSMLIHDLRVKMEEAAKKLEALEKDGKEDSANMAMWVAHGAWCGNEYSAIEKALRSKGHKSVIG